MPTRFRQLHGYWDSSEISSDSYDADPTEQRRASLRRYTGYSFVNQYYTYHCQLRQSFFCHMARGRRISLLWKIENQGLRKFRGAYPASGKRFLQTTRSFLILCMQAGAARPRRITGKRFVLHHKERAWLYGDVRFLFCAPERGFCRAYVFAPGSVI